ncbi:MAG: hypothetical protein KA063_04215 [Firmicutes bacterium]|nr:hypothetical protein [Bacillota bacterium]
MFKSTTIPPGMSMTRNNLEAELLSEKVLNLLGVPAPKADFAWFDTGNGVEQLLRVEFVDNTLVPDEFDRRYGLNAVDGDLFKRMQVIDVLIGNGDRHKMNFLFSDNGIGKVIPIDHNMAFGTKKVFQQGETWQRCFIGNTNSPLASHQTPEYIVCRNSIGGRIGRRDGTDSYLPIIKDVQRLADPDIDRMVIDLTADLAEPDRKLELIEILKYRRDHLIDFFRSIIW